MRKIFLLFSLLALFQIILPTDSNQVEINAFLDKETNTIYYKGKTYNNFNTYKHEELEILAKKKIPEEKTLSRPQFFFNVLMVILLTLLAGAMSGLTVGYLSIDELVLEIKAQSGTEEEKYYAAKIQPVIANHHWLLVTLLVCNAFANETLPIVLDTLVSEVMAIVISVTLVLFFGEIIPQALCTGPNQLKIASFLAPLTRALMYATFIVSYPMGLLIDVVVGKHLKNRFCNSDLKALIELHTVDAISKIKEIEKESNEMGEDVGLNDLQVNAMKGVLDARDLTVKEIMKPFDQVEILSIDEKLTKDVIKRIVKKGYSRIPVYKGDINNIVGILRTKQLIQIAFNLNKKGELDKSIFELNMKLNHPLVLNPDCLISSVIKDFVKGKSHIAVVTQDVTQVQQQCGLNIANSYKEDLDLAGLIQRFESEKDINKKRVSILGIVTLEDLIEHLININIMDEDDYHKKKKEKLKSKSKEMGFNEKAAEKIAESFVQEKKEEIGSCLNKPEVPANPANLLGMNPDIVFTDSLNDKGYELLPDEANI